MRRQYESFEQFWPYYLQEHSKPLTRRLHVMGTLLLLPILLAGVFLDWRFFILLPLCGYGFAWTSHAFIERNKPATFDYPLWSLLADFKMCYLMVTGKTLK